MRRRVLAGLSYVALLFLWVPSAAAALLDVFFDGPANAGTNYGISRTSAQDARTKGVPWMSADVVGSAATFYGLSSSSVLSFSPIPPVGTDNRAHESWTVKNESGGSLEGASYLLFTHTPSFVKNGVSIDFTDDNVGLEIDGALGWVIFDVASSLLGTVYYPAIELNGIAAIDAVSSPFDIRYVVKEPLVQAPPGSGFYQLPRFAVARAFTPIPEPGTAALLVTGFLLLAVRRRFSR